MSALLIPQATSSQDKHTVLLFDWALINFSRKWSQSPSDEASSTTISFQSSDILYKIYLMLLVSLSSLNFVMHSGEIETLLRKKPGQWCPAKCGCWLFWSCARLPAFGFSRMWDGMETDPDWDWMRRRISLRQCSFELDRNVPWCRWNVCDKLKDFNLHPTVSQIPPQDNSFFGGLSRCANRYQTYCKIRE